MKALKKIVKFPLLVIVRLNYVYRLIKWLHVIAEYEYCKKISYGKNINLDKVFSDLEVKNGAFKGMKYPDLISCGSSIYPKLLGFYEPELNDIFDIINSKTYSEIIDIGCAEGYYAIGLALKHPAARIFAYDTNSLATKQCEKMAKLNNVNERISIGGFFSPEELGNFKFSNKGLIICDCEGYENQLFNSDNIDNLKNIDLLIEIHDFVDYNISYNVLELFNYSHDYQVVRSMDDTLKLNKQLSKMGFKEIEKLSYYDQFQAVAECRRFTMEWIFFTPKPNVK